MDGWIHFKEIDFTDESVTIYHIDTRDFHCSMQRDEDRSGLDVNKLSKYPTRFFHTPERIVEILTRLFEESGGPVKWRYLIFEGDREYSHNWQLKYLRIHRTPLGLVICDNRHIAIRNEILEYAIDKEHCFAH